MNKHVISVDMGGTNIRIGIVNQYGEVTNKKSVFTHADLGKESVVERLIKLIRSIYKNSVKIIIAITVLSI